MNPGSKMDSVLILSGSMGLRKSTAIKMLPPDESWYDETTRLDIDNKDALSSMNSAWQFELSEIEKLTSTRESSVLKAWVSRSCDKYVEKYESVTTEHPRRTCLWGTTNAGEFLNDPTGSRRYWIAFVVNPCDTNGLRENRDRLWAHCLSEGLEGMPYFLNPTDALMVEASRRGGNATLADPWHEKLDSILSDKHKTGDFLSTQNLFALIDCNQIVNHEDLSDLQTLERHTPLDARRLANAMNALGWRSYRTSKERGYIKL
jgi:predicted P-loop ATPase